MSIFLLKEIWFISGGEGYLGEMVLKVQYTCIISSGKINLISKKSTFPRPKPAFHPLEKQMIFVRNYIREVMASNNV